MKQIKIFEADYFSLLEEMVNRFLADRCVLDIQYKPLVYANSYGVVTRIYAAMVVYEEE